MKKTGKVIDILQKDAVGKVVIGGYNYYSGEVTLFLDGTVLVPGIKQRMKPGDNLYQLTSAYSNQGESFTTERSVAYQLAEQSLADGVGLGKLEILISADDKIDRNYTSKSPGFRDENDLDSLFNEAPSYQDYRYKAIRETTNTNAELMAAEKIDAEFGNIKPSIEELKSYRNGVTWVDT